jgi:hypothetical protein
MKVNLNQHEISPLELNCLLVAVDSEIESQQTYFSDIVDSPCQHDRDCIGDVHERIVALHTVKAKLTHLWKEGA